MLNILLIVDSHNIDIEYITKDCTKDINYYIHTINTNSERILTPTKIFRKHYLDSRLQTELEESRA